MTDLINLMDFKFNIYKNSFNQNECKNCSVNENSKYFSDEKR